MQQAWTRICAYSAGVVVTKDVFMLAELKDPVFLVKAPGLLVSQPLPWDPKP